MSGTLTLNGEITADGNYWRGAWYHAIGGGSGGSIYVTAGTLAGSGKFTADGNLNGGGGRVAVYYQNGDAFSGFVSSTSAAGDNSSQRGTTAFFRVADLANHLSDPTRHLYVYKQFRFENEDAVVALGDITVGSVASQNAALAVAGGTVLQAGSIEVVGNSTILCQSKNATGQVDGQWAGAGVAIRALSMSVGAGSVITADSQGYCKGQGPGGTADPYIGGSYGGRGKGNSAATYGSAMFPNDLGSGAGAESNSNSYGGGLIRLDIQQTLAVDGEITADGGAYQAWWQHAVAGGSGGTIFINAGSLAGSGRITADGHEWGGGGGRVAIHCWGANTLPSDKVTALGKGGGQNGTVSYNTSPVFRWTAPSPTLFHDTISLAWEALAVPSAGATAEVVAVGPGGTVSLGTALPIVGRLDWDTRSVADGVYELQAIFRNAAGQPLNRLTRFVLVQNQVVWHGGWITRNETWNSGAVHVVERDVAIRAGATLTIEPGAVVKFAPGTRLNVENGGSLQAPATEQRPVILTSLADDTAGGDTNLDGSQSLAQPGDWGGLSAAQGGNVNLSQHVQVRYAQQTHAGAVGANEVWSGTFMHYVVGDVTIPAGSTLTIQPGAVVKFGSKLGITVQAGGALVAQGGVAQPIVFTSIKDDSFGGDTNRDGNASSPAAGDWRWLHVAGGTADLDHVEMRYGGGTASGNWDNTGMVRTSTASARATISNSRLLDAFYEAVLAQGGTIALTNCVIAGADRGVNSDVGAAVVLTNCTLDNNRVGVWSHGGATEVVNTIVSNSREMGVWWWQGHGAPPTIRYSDVWSSTGTNYSQMDPQTGLNGNISADPRYREASRGDYRLDYRGPAIDAADGDRAPDVDFTGAPRYDDPRTANSGVPMPAGGAVPDMGAFEFVETAQSNVDLVVASVTGPSTALAGERATVQWTITNRGSAPAVGPWHDRVFLVRNPDTSPDPILAAELLVGTGVVLGPGQSYAASGEVRVPGSTAGWHRWQVTTNARAEVFEGQNTANNTTCALSTVFLDLPELPIDGAAIPGQFSAPGESHWFKMVPPANRDVSVELNLAGNGGVAELYVARGYLPDRNHFDSRQDQWRSANAAALVADSWADTYYVTAFAESLEGAPAGFTIQASTLDFSLDASSPIRASNTGEVTLELRGGRLRREYAYRLVAADGGRIPAKSVFWQDSSLVYATFDLAGRPPGVLGVEVAAPGPVVRTLPDALTVVGSGSAGVVEARVLVPPVVRSGREFTITVEYENTGFSDVAAPLFNVIASGTATLRDDGRVLGISPEGPAGVLRPGSLGSFTVAAFCTGEGPFSVSLFQLTTADQTPIDWNAVEAQVKPPETDPAKWNPTWARFVADTGNTWGQYVDALSKFATLAAERGERIAGSLELLQYAIRETYNQVFDNVAGTVYLDTFERPLAGAIVSALDEATGQTSIAQTQRDGSFRFFQLGPGTYTISVEGYLATNATPITVEAAPVSEYTLLVTQGGAVEGTVRDWQGQPLADIPVTLRDPAGKTYSGNTNGVGAYRISGLPGGVFEAFVPDFGDSCGQRIEGVAVTEGQTVRGVDFSLARAARVLGTVCDANTGLPIASARVAIVGASDSNSAVTGPQGQFALSGLAPGSYVLAVSAPGYADPAAREFALEGGQTLAGQDFALRAGASLRVTATDARTGASVPGVGVWLALDGQQVAVAITGDDGAAVLENLSAGTYELRVEKTGRLQRTEQITLTAGGQLTRAFALEPSGSIHGAVKDQLGQPVAQIAVWLSSVDDLTVGYQTITDANGEFDFGLLQLGTYRVFLGNQTQSQTAVLDADHRTRTVDITAMGASLEGTVFQSDGTTPASDAVVALLEDGVVVVTARTNSDGRYAFQLVKTGSYQVRAGCSAGLTPAVAVVVEGSGAITVPPLVLGGSSIVGRVFEQGSVAPLAGVSIYVGVRDLADTVFDSLLGAVSDEQGMFRVEGLTPGGYVLFAVDGVHAFARQEISLPPAGPTEVGLAMRAGRSLSGTIASAATGQPVTNATVVARLASSGEVAGTAATDANGRYTIQGLTEGTYDLSAYEANYQRATAGNVLVGGATATRDFLLLDKSTLLAGTVTNGAGDPMPNVLVTVYDGSGRHASVAATDAAGRFTVDSLAPGTYSLRAEANGFRRISLENVELQPGHPWQMSPMPTTPVGAPMPHPPQGPWPPRPQPPRPPEPPRPPRPPEPPQHPVDPPPGVDLSFIGDWIGSVVEHYKNINPKPERSPIHDLQPNLPAPACDKSSLDDYAYKKALQAWRMMDGMFTGPGSWTDCHDKFNLVLYERLIVHAGDAGSIWLNAIFLFGNLAESLKNARGLIYAEKILQAGRYEALVNMIDGIFSGAMQLYNDLTSTSEQYTGRDKAAYIIGFVDHCMDLVGGTAGLGHFLRDIECLQSAPSLTNALGKIGFASTCLSALMNLYISFGDLKNQSKATNDAREGYERACDLFEKWRNRLHEANRYCNATVVVPWYVPVHPQHPAGGAGGHGSNSNDPNDKVTIGAGPQAFVAQSAAICYTIHFENLATAGLPAQQVVVTDALDANLDWSGFQLGQIGFNNVVLDVPAGLQNYTAQTAVETDPNPVRVNASLDPTTGIVTWTISSIDAFTLQLVDDPIAGFLPPNNAQHQGEGFVTFRVRPKPGLPTGTQISNQARIVFDVNEPIDTNEVLNTIDADAPTAALAESAPAPVVKDWELNARGYLDVVFRDLGSGLNPETIFDSQAEFVLSGAGAAGVAVNGVPTLVDGAANTYRYTFSGAFSNGPVTITFPPGAFADNVGHLNETVTQNFEVQFEPSFWIDTPQPALEGSKTGKILTFPVRLTGPVNGTVTVRYATANGTAIAGKDFKAARGTLKFAPNKPLTQNIKVVILDDKLYEGSETFQVKLSSPKGKVAVPLAVGTATGTILENDPMPRISIRDVSIREGNQGTKKAVFVVALSGKSSLTTTVDYATADGTATVADGDYRAAIGTLSFAPGVTTRTITVWVNGDRNFEPNETFQVNLSNPANATLARTRGTTSSRLAL